MQFNKLSSALRQGLTTGRLSFLTSRYSASSGGQILHLSRTSAFHTAVKQIPNRYQRISRFQYQTIRNLRTTSVLLNDIVEVTTPGFPESITEGDIKWQKAVGDFVKVDEAIGEIETDKTAMPVPAPVAGVIVELLVPNNGKVGAKQVVVKIKPGAEPASKAAEAKPKEEKKSEAQPKKPESAAASRSPPPREMPSVPPVSKQPMSEQPVGKPTPAPVSSKPSAPPPPPPTGAPKKGTPGIDYISGSRGEQRVKMSRMRLRIAARLKEAQNTSAMLTTFNECDLSNLTEMRKMHGDAFAKKHGFKLGFMGAFVRASAHALHDQPVVNAMIDDATQEVVYRDYVDVSVAVATPKGLVVPVVRGVDRMSFAEVEAEIARLGEKARLNKLAIEDMDGGTFTISNGGVFGGLFGTPILNPPQSAVLGMYGIKDRVMAINGKPEVRSMMYLALTYDHRLIDGREAVLFLRKVKAVIEDPRLLLLDV